MELGDKKNRQPICVWKVLSHIPSRPAYYFMLIEMTFVKLCCVALKIFLYSYECPWKSDTILSNIKHKNVIRKSSCFLT